MNAEAVRYFQQMREASALMERYFSYAREIGCEIGSGPNHDTITIYCTSGQSVLLDEWFRREVSK